MTPFHAAHRAFPHGVLAVFGLSLLVPASFAQQKLRVAAIYSAPVEQQWVSCVHRALVAARDRGDIDYKLSQSVAASDYERILRQYAESGTQLVVGDAFGAEAEVRRVAKDYPGIAFLVGSSLRPQAPNLSVFDDYIQESSFLSGMIAGALTRSGRIGMVGGFPIPEVNRLMNAFMAGVHETNPRAAFLVTFIGSWFDPPKAKQAAFAQMDAGADVLYAERFGVSDAAKERGLLAIGNMTDSQPLYPATVVVSALWHMEPTIDHAISAVRSGRFKAEDYGKYSTMAFRGDDLSPLGTFKDRIPSAVMARVAGRRADILAGTFHVAVVETEPVSGQ
jgi:basic membrane lipoprotein Med (substrate-binding protein (PBP1-ABC) superfamily)